MKNINFSKYRKKLKLKKVKTCYIPLSEIKCQYNPNLFRFWDEVCGHTMDLTTTPFYKYLMYKDIDPYKKLFNLYGRPETWITNNIMKFQQMTEEINKNGFCNELPIVLEKPVIKNKWNDSFEVWEGHRRLSICRYYNIEQKVKLCRIV